MTNRLKIDADRLKLEFTGDAQEIRSGYEMTRELLIHHFQEQLMRVEEEAARRAAPPSPVPGATQQMHLPVQEGRAWEPERGQGVMHVSMVLSSSFYNKICVLEREEYRKSFLEELFVFERLGRLYVRHNQAEFFQQRFKVGKVLWRELTADGRAAVRNE